MGVGTDDPHPRCFACPDRGGPVVALASAFIRLRPEVDRREAQKAGEEVGKAAGDAAGKGLKGGIDKGLEEARARAAATGGAAGKAWGDGFHRDSQGKIRDAQGKFVQSSIAGGDDAGKGFARGFGKGSSGIIGAIKGNLKLAAGVFVPLGLAAAVGEIGKIGMAYEDNLNVFKQVSKATGDQMAAVADQARALGSDIQLPGVSAAGAAAAMTELAKAGFTVDEAMAAAKGTLQLARVAQISEADAAEIAANAVNAFGVAASDTGFVVDELAAAANSSSISVTEASASFKQAAAVFSGVQGESVGAKEAITELNTAVAILGNNGIKGSDAGTSLKQMLLQLTGPTEQAKNQMQLLAAKAAGANVTLAQQDQILHGTKKERNAALEAVRKLNAGMDLEGDIAYDSAGKMRPLRDIIGLVTAGTKDMTQEERNYAVTQIFGADASRAVLALMKGGLPVYDAQRKAVMETGAAAANAAAQNAGLKGAIDNVRSQIENAAIEIYNVVRGPLTTGLNNFAAALPGIFNGIKQVVGFLYDNRTAILSAAYAYGVYTAAVKASAAANAIAAAGGIIPFLTKFVTAIRAATAGQIAFNIALIANPIGITVVAIGALVAAFVLAYRNSETFRKIVQGALNGIKVAAQAVGSWFMGTLLPILKTVWNGIAAGALWLWRNVIVPVWNGIKAAISVAVVIIKAQIQATIAVFRAIGAVAMFLWRNSIAPAFSAIKKIIDIFVLTAKIAFAAVKNIIMNVIVPVIRFLYNNTIKPIFTLAGALIARWWSNTVKPAFEAARAAFGALGSFLKRVWETVIRPVFNALGGFIKNTVAPAFAKGVDAIRAAWAKVQEAARKPVAFVVNKVINPFIGGLNAAAKVVGVKDRVDTIKGFAAGGKISGAGGFTDNKQAMVPGLGPVQLMGGEFVVNRRDTAKALPLLRWINSGMSGGADRAASYLGKPLAREPGDGSEGWAFAKGGLVGWAKDVWGAISDPKTALEKPFNAALNGIPGGGMIKGFLTSSAKKLLKAAVGWLGGFGGGTGGTFSYHGPRSGRVGAAASFIKAQEGKPYVWASAGPRGYDCSGIVSAAYNILKGRSPYGHTFSTASLPGAFFDRGNRTSPLLAGWSHPGQRPASARVGHMAGQIAGMPFESTGSRGVRVGGSARKVGEFASVGGARLAGGGLVPGGIRLFDNGGAWPSGTLGVNMSGRTEYVDPNRRGARGGAPEHLHLHFHGPVSSEKAAEDLVVTGYLAAKRKRRIP